MKRIKYCPCIVVLAGPPLTGKTSAGVEMEKMSNLKYLDVDEARKDLYGYKERGTDEGENAKMLASYRRNHDLAEKLLFQGIPVILGATYSKEKYHKLLIDLQKKTRFPLRVFIFKISDKELERRVEGREKQGNLSNIRDLAIAKRLKAEYIPMTGDFVQSVDSYMPATLVIREIQKSLVDLQLEK